MSKKVKSQENNAIDHTDHSPALIKQIAGDDLIELKDLETRLEEKEDISVLKEAADLEENHAENADSSCIQPQTAKKKKPNLFLILRIAFGIGFLVFTGLFVNEVFLQPWRMNKAVNLTRELYVKPSLTPITYIPKPTNAPDETSSPINVTVTPSPDLIHDDQGRLLTFKELLAKNEDTKGWITIPGTNIDYVVLQNKEDPMYYLTRDFNREKQKAGSLFLDKSSSVENNTKNLVIHGHNMKSTDNMFHYIEKFKKLDYFKEHPTLQFDTIYQTGIWKIFSVFITNGSDKKEPFFNYTQSTFQDSSEYLNFLYQLRIRSLFLNDSVDLSENDQIVTLSTCSYEIYDYRTVIVARKVRSGEDILVNSENISDNPAPLYPSTYYKNYGGEAPEFPATFEEAMEQGLINWYKPVEE